MTVLTPETKARKMRDALAELASQYIKEGKLSSAKLTVMFLEQLEDSPDSLARLYDAFQKVAG